jgi:hypothetical protein
MRELRDDKSLFNMTRLALLTCALLALPWLSIGYETGSPRLVRSGGARVPLPRMRLPSCLRCLVVASMVHGASSQFCLVSRCHRAHRLHFFVESLRCCQTAAPFVHCVAQVACGKVRRRYFETHSATGTDASAYFVRVMAHPMPYACRCRAHAHRCMSLPSPCSQVLASCRCRILFQRTSLHPYLATHVSFEAGAIAV